MFPASLLPQLSPNACKLYLTLHTHYDPAHPAPVHLPMNALTTLSSLAPRTCARALRELYAAQLVRRLPFAYHHPRTYELLPYPQPAQPPQADLLDQSPTTDQPAQATLLTKTDQPPQADHHTQAPTPVPTTNNPIPPLQADLLNQSHPTTLPHQATHPSPSNDPMTRSLNDSIPPNPTYSREDFRKDFAKLSIEGKVKFLEIISARLKASANPQLNTYPQGV